MPDEPEQQHDQHDGPDGHPIEDADGDKPTTDPAHDPAAAARTEGTEANADDENDDEPTDSSEGTAEPRQLSVMVRNLSVLGHLSLHYPSRDVTVLLDGDAAMRLMAMYAQRRERGLADLLDPVLSSAESGWVVLDIDEPLAMSWLPGLPGKRPRTTIDPALVAA